MRMLPAFGGERGIALDFCSPSRIISFETLRKNLRSPFQNNTPCCFDHCVRIPIIFSPKAKKHPHLRMLPAFGGERGIALDFCSPSRIISFETFRKNLRSPFQNNTPCCFSHCVRIPIIFSPKSKKHPQMRMLPAFGGERGIRTLVCLRTN